MSDYSAVNPPTDSKVQSQAFAAALQRAKEIAAKIQPSSKASSTTGSISPEIHKRPLDDYNNTSEPDRKRIATSPVALAAAQAAAVAARVAAAAAGVQGIGGPGSQFNNVVNEEIKVPDKMVGLSRGGGQISRLQAETGCKIQMAPDSPGILERSCTLTGNAQSITLAKEMIQNIVQNKVSVEGTGGAKIEGLNISSPPSQPAFSQAQIMIPGAKVGLIIGKGGETIKMLQESSGAKMIVIQDGPNSQEAEKPLRISGETSKVEHAKKLVYDMLGGLNDKDGMSNFDQNGSNWNGSNSDYGNHSGYGGKVEVGVPKQVVGLVIGKGGDMIKKIQAETGAKVQFINLNEDTPDDRRCLITGAPDQVAEAKQRIDSLVDSALNRGGNRQSGNFNRNQNWGNSGQTQPLNETTFTVPAAKCGVIIGKGGETIKQINMQTGAHCEIDRRQNNAGTEKTFVIRGTTEQIENAKRMINDKLGFDPNGGSQNYGGMNQPYGSQMNWGAQDSQMNPYGQSWNPGMQQQSQPPADQSNLNQMPAGAGGQAGSDFSAQWIQYYRSMGMHREAEFIEQQAKQMKFNGQMNGANGVPPGSVQQQPQPGALPPNGVMAVNPVVANGAGGSAAGSAGTPDYSAQWIDYYRSIGKVKEAEMVEQQVKARQMAMQNPSNGQPSGSDQSPQQPNTSSPQSGQQQPMADVSNMYGTQYGMAYGAGGYYGGQNSAAAPSGYGAYASGGNAYAGYQQMPQQDPPQQ
ncbi:far upstream element-binding protein 3 isoform X2 [Daktulosphaira vitifoliae]|uniref:far upstream element-binding protein 3 isoform X2 n=1 Tax=Daktulosphaira vitifoliae TaxID=58002 RepID=UPI0021AA9657|nr:far upstream element-binding protein 3 isoform X2 [Daktulosphaira vitifoliae]